MRPALPLAGAVVATGVLLAVAWTLPAPVADCASAGTAVDSTNSAHQDALRNLERASVRARRDGPEAAGMPAAQSRVDQAKAELTAARGASAALCRP